MAKLYDLKSLWLCVGVSTIFAGWGIIRITANEPGGLISWRQRRGAAFFASPGRWTRTHGHDEAVLTVPSPGNGCEFWSR